MNNRSRAFTDMKDVLCNKDNKYEIVIGPVADGNMALKKGEEERCVKKTSCWNIRYRILLI